MTASGNVKYSSLVQYFRNDLRFILHFGVIWYIIRNSRLQLTNDAHAQTSKISMAVQTHLELIFNKKFGDINSTLENIEASTDALLNRFYNKKTGLDDEIKTYLTKKFNEVNTKNYENMLALYDKLQERV
ncbi:unnamed protein product [Rhizophagus irregularis]|nr:unnamed protein product [Rhizophagus irregularis]CAB5338365.1 unnamed protein product [Rhizophagus irregularis]